MNLTPEEGFSFYMTDECYICNKPFYKDKKNNYIKVRDHCHYTGKYKGAAHKICNLMYNIHQEKYQLYFIMEVVMIINV